MSKAPDKTTTTRTRGEELYLVHLTRYEPSPDDFDVDGIRKNRPRSMSAGEELWDIHCRRSRNRIEEEEEKEDEDDKQDDDKIQAEAEPEPTPKKRRTTTTAADSAVTRPIKAIRSLRNREIAIV